jgi:hypothetical protein
VCGGTHSPLSTRDPSCSATARHNRPALSYKGSAAVHKTALSGPGRARSQLGRVNPNVPHRLCGAAHVTAQPGRTVTGHVHTTTCQAALGIRRTSVCVPVCARVRLRVHALVCTLVCANSVCVGAWAPTCMCEIANGHELGGVQPSSRLYGSAIVICTAKWEWPKSGLAAVQVGDCDLCSRARPRSAERSRDAGTFRPSKVRCVHSRYPQQCWREGTRTVDTDVIR